MARNDGAALLEVIVALTILATAGAGVLAMAGQALHAFERSKHAMQEIRAANAFLEVVSLWTREDLDRRLGTREQGPWRLQIERVAPTLYRIELHDTGGQLLLSTSVHRPEPARDER